MTNISADKFFTLQTVCMDPASPQWQADFFPRPWAVYAEVGALGLRIRTGQSRHVFIRQGGTDGQVLVQQRCAPGLTVLPIGRADACGDWLICEVENTAVPDSDLKIEWVCSAPPVHAPAIAIIICTFNRDQQLRLVLDALGKQREAIGHICIVNQGHSGLAARVRREDDPSFLQIVEQANYGGAGGFTRGLMESLKMRGMTHFLFMDDDVEISDTLIIRLKAICAYVPDSICIGGAMLDIRNPDSVVSLGHRIDVNKCAVRDIVPKEGMSLNDEVTLRQMAELPDVDFCGWWCFCFPQRAVEQCGLPLPFFIRGDDAEYGLRLTHAGFRTVMWPGIAVKHNALTSQTQAWHHFYDRRNALLCSLLYSPKGQAPSVASLVRGIINAMVTYRYDFAEAGIGALRAYQRGADALAEWGAESHRRLLANRIKDEAAPAERPVAITCYPTPFFRTLISVMRIIHDYFAPQSQINHMPVVNNRDWVSGTRQRPEGILAKTGDKVTRLVRDPKRFRAIFHSLIKGLVAQYFRKPPSKQNIWKMTTIEWWENFLKISGK
ncbi:glycosyl transferase [Komagataeibacter diospyri]|uniref:glycosyltransferase family 2 protein n=1 Tax=Komagataeibacter diospyri TaxID=1932662 RepID=UPI0011393BBB|nr:glycosyltransferase family 2 protein [Komagataeibacter diospyri]GCE90691.1 glycosyl transferase [Komagataeibacter diospyri]